MPYVYSHKALSGEARAASSMYGAIDDRSQWISIQLNTFKNWANEQLAKSGLKVNDVGRDFADGTLLIALVEVLQQRQLTGKIHARVPTDLQMRLNCQIALDALLEDGIKLVNIGSDDIVEGNLKLLLGLVWCLILRYQFATKTKVPPKKLLLAWLKAVLPDLKITNFGSCWNDGIALSALLNYCKPGTIPDWRLLNKKNRIENCRNALKMANDHFGVPAIISPEDFASDHLDELSCLTYLSYFINVGGPGYQATLERVNRLIPDYPVSNFQGDWMDGIALCYLVHQVGGTIPNWPHLSNKTTAWLDNLNTGINGARHIGVSSLVSAQEMLESEVEHYAMMILAAELCALNQPPVALPIVAAKVDPVKVMPLAYAYYKVDQKVHVEVLFLDRSMQISDLRVRVVDPNGQYDTVGDLTVDESSKGAVVSFSPNLPGQYKVYVWCPPEQELKVSPVKVTVVEKPTPVPQPQLLLPTPVSVLPQPPVIQQPPPPVPSPPPPPSPPVREQLSRAATIAAKVPVFRHQESLTMPIHPQHLDVAPPERPVSRCSDIGRVSFSGLTEPCAVGSIVEVVINAHGDSQGSVLVEATSPARRLHKCQVVQKGTAYTATFTPNEVGEWQIGILYDGEHIKGSPFSCYVYDANLVQVYGLDVGVVGQELKFNINTSQAGEGEIKTAVYHHGRLIPSYSELQAGSQYRVHFTPDGAGQYKIHVYFNNMEVKASPFVLDIVDSSSVSVYGDSLRMASVGKLSTFMIHTVGAESKDITVSITAPSGKKKRATVTPMGDSAYRVEWKPVEAGEHYIDVRLYNQSVHDSPFTCNVGDADLVTVRNMPTAIRHTELGEAHGFEIDASAAGSGNLEIMINSGRVACKVRELGSRHYLAQFTPVQPVTHVVEMRFNGEPVKGSPWRIDFQLPPTATAGVPPSAGQQPAYMLTPLNVNEAISSTTTTTTQQYSGGAATTTTTEAIWADIQGSGLQKACVGKISSFEVGGKGLLSDDIAVKLAAPSGAETPCKVITGRTGNYRCEYVATEVGTYNLTLFIRGQVVDGSPFPVNAYAPHKVAIEPVPGGAVGKPVQFIVDANEAGKGQLEIAVNQGSVPNSVQMQGSGRCLVTFIPTSPGTYIIDVTFNDELVKGCPVRVEINEFAKSGDVAEVTQLTRSQTATTSYETARPTSTELISETEQIRETRREPPNVPSSYVMMQRQQYETRTGLESKEEYKSAYEPKVLGSRSFQSEKRYNITAPSTRYTDSGVTTGPQYVRETPLETVTKKPKMESPPIFRTRDDGVGATVATYGEKEPETIIYEERTTYTTSYLPEREQQREYERSTFSTYDLQKQRDNLAKREAPPEYYEDERMDYNQGYYVEELVEPNAVLGKDRGDHFVESWSGRRPVGGYYYEGAAPQPRRRSPVQQQQQPKTTRPVGHVYATEYTEGLPDEYRGGYERIYGQQRSTAAYQQASPPRARDSEAYQRTTYQSYGYRNYDSAATAADNIPPADYDDEPMVQECWEPNQVLAKHPDIVIDGMLSRKPKGFTPQETELIINEELLRTPLVKEPLFSSKENIPEGLYCCDEGRRDPTHHVHGIKKEEEKLVKKTVDRDDKAIAEYRRVTPLDIETAQSRAVLLRETSLTLSPTGLDETKRISAVSSGKVGEAVAKLEEKEYEQCERAVEATTAAVAFASVADMLGRAKIEGESVVRVLETTTFVVAPLACNRKDLKVIVTGPNKENLHARVERDGQGFLLEVTPKEVGTHSLFVQVEDKVHPDGPFTFKVYDPDSIYVSDIRDASLGEHVTFEVDAQRAGFGNLEIAIKDADEQIIPSTVEGVVDHQSKFVVGFVPEQMGVYKINISFNGESLKRSPFKCTVSGAAAIAEEFVRQEQEIMMAKEEQGIMTESAINRTEDRLVKTEDMLTAVELVRVDDVPQMVLVDHPATLSLNVKGSGPLTSRVTDANGEFIPSKIIQGEQQLHRVEFTPRTVGDHNVSVQYSGRDVRGSPFLCRAYDPKRIKVADIPNGLVGQPVHFVVDASEAGVGNLEVSVNDGRVPSMAHSLGQHRYEVSFVPNDAEPHTITIRFNNEPVHGSPFSCHIVSSTQVTASGTGLERVPVRDVATFYIDPREEALDQQPMVEITDQSGEPVKCRVERQRDEKFLVRWTPTTVGNHQIQVSVEGVPISGSPFTAKAYDVNRVKLYPVEGNWVGRPANFFIDAAKAGAGNMEIVVSVDDRNVPNFVQPEGNAKFKVSFTPTIAKAHVISVKFNGEPVPGSPMMCEVLDGSESELIGEVSTARVNQPSSFVVRAPPTGDGKERSPDECHCVVTAPSKQLVNADVQTTADGAFAISFKPQETGPHKIDVSFLDVPLRGSPFICNVHDVAQVHIGKAEVGFIGKPWSVQITTGEASEHGDIEAEVQTADGEKHPCSLEQDQDSCLFVKFTPTSCGQHFVTVKCGGMSVFEKPTAFEVFNLKDVTLRGEGTTKAQVGQKAHFSIKLPSELLEDRMTVKISDSMSNPVPCTLSREKVCKFSVNYMAASVGPHKVSVSVAGHDISDSPLQVDAFDLSAVHLIGLKDNEVWNQQEFQVDYGKAGKGTVAVEITHDDLSIPHSLDDNNSGSTTVRFLPKSAGLYCVNVKFNGIPLPECPYECRISDNKSIRVQGSGLKTVPVNRLASFDVVLTEAGKGELDVLVSSPNKGAVPVKCYQLPDGLFKVEYTPTVAGRHKVDVTFGGVPVAGSPFEVDVVESVKSVQILTQRNQAPLVVKQKATVLVRREETASGAGDLKAYVEDPAGQRLEAKVLRNANGEDEISFFPNRLGEHRLFVIFNGVPTVDSPMRLQVMEANRPTAYGEGLQRAMVEEPAQFIFDTRKAKGGMKIEILGPQSKVKHTSAKKSDGLYEITYTPIEPGAHTVSVLWNNKPITGSPFKVAVLDLSKVLFAQSGLDHRGNIALNVGEEKQLSVDAVDAGPGYLRAEVRGPSGSSIDCQTTDLGYGKHRVVFTPRLEGEHSVYLFWCDMAVPQSPIQGWAEVLPTSSMALRREAMYSSIDRGDDEVADEHLRIVVKGAGLREARTREEAEFIVDASDAARGHPQCSIMGHKADIPVTLTPIGANVWRASYTPLIAGKYNLEVKWDDGHVRGSPFKLDVQQTGEANKILVGTDSLKMGIIGDEVKTTIDTRLAGPGQLSAQCLGPNKLAYCELYDHRDGTYTLCIRPSEIGKHTLVIKYNDEHVDGSPFTVHVSQPPDASKVRVLGPGVEHGILSTYKSNFIVETKGAGAGQLTVRVRGPKGAFNVEMQREKKNDRTIHCKYDPREPGDYQIEVKWAGEHVQGSPFLAMIFDTQQELERYHAGQAPSPPPAAPFLPPGWIGPPPPGMLIGPPPGAPPMALPPGPMGYGPRPLMGPPPMLALPGPEFPQRGLPYANSTIYSTRSNKSANGRYAQNGY